VVYSLYSVMELEKLAPVLRHPFLHVRWYNAASSQRRQSCRNANRRSQPRGGGGNLGVGKA
jgi:hypothetical protein